MKKILFLMAVLLLAVSSYAIDAENTTAKGCCENEKMRPLSDYTIFQMCVWDGYPSASVDSNVFGIKTGQVMSGGYGRVYGLEASWFGSLTDHIKGFQACWLVCKNKHVEGIQASFFILNISECQFDGIQATLGVNIANTGNGLQASSLNVSGNMTGVQPAAIMNYSGDITGFQAAVILNMSKKLKGFQTSLINMADESNGFQLGFMNTAKKTGAQFGLINYIEDAPIPFMPIFNMSF